MPRVEKSKEFLVQALGFPSVKEGGGEHLNSSETHLLPWTSQILGGVRPPLAGTRSSLAHILILLMLCHRFPGGVLLVFESLTQDFLRGAPTKTWDSFCCLWLCDYPLSH